MPRRQSIFFNPEKRELPFRKSELRWVVQSNGHKVFQNYSPISFKPLSQVKRGRKRKTDLLEDIAIKNVASSLRTATVEQVHQAFDAQGLTLKRISTSTIASRLRDFDGKTVRALPDQLSS